MKLIPNNWGDFQHYKDRAPAWIKLHKNLLDNYEFQCLPVASRALAPMLWLLASECEDGVLDTDYRKLAFRLRMTEAEVCDAIKPLITQGFFSLEQDASEVLADRKQDACLEKRREEREKEGEKRLTADPSGSSAPSPGSVAFDAYASAYRTRYGVNPVRNAKVNSMFKTLAGQLGVAAGPVAAWYVTSENLATYTKSSHDPALLLRDAAGLHTRWQQQSPMSTRTARAADDATGDMDMVRRVAARFGENVALPSAQPQQIEHREPLI